MLGFALLRPFSGNYVLLYLVGAVLATLFEYLTARLMLRLFGTFWWDYTNKPFNYKGILCLESTLGWGLIALLLFAFLHRLGVPRCPAHSGPCRFGGCISAGVCLCGGFCRQRVSGVSECAYFHRGRARARRAAR